jgi:hypothetical protein
MEIMMNALYWLTMALGVTGWVALLAAGYALVKRYRQLRRGCPMWSNRQIFREIEREIRNDSFWRKIRA